MLNKIKIIKKFTFILGIVLIVLGLIPLPLLSNIDIALGGDCKKENAECSVNESGKPCCYGPCIPFNDNSGNGKCPGCTPTYTQADCPTGCGLPESTHPDGCGKTVTCKATADCCIPSYTINDCPDECGLAESTVDDGCGGTVTCAATAACGCNPTFTVNDCPDECGLAESTVDDGCGGTVTCAATAACTSDDDDDQEQQGGGGGGTIVPVTAAGGELVVIPVTGVDLGCNVIDLQNLFIYTGMMMFGVSLLLESASRKFRI